MFEERCLLCVVLPAGIGSNDSGVGWKQLMMLLEEVLVCGGVAFHPPCASRVNERDSSVCARCHKSSVESMKDCLDSIKVLTFMATTPYPA